MADLLPMLDFEAMEKDRLRREALPVHDSEHPRGFERDDDCGGWDIWWGGYCYFIEDDRIATQSELLGWIEHLGEKTWEGLTPIRIARLIRAVRKHHGWAFIL